MMTDDNDDNDDDDNDKDDDENDDYNNDDDDGWDSFNTNPLREKRAKLTCITDPRWILAAAERRQIAHSA